MKCFIVFCSLLFSHVVYSAITEVPVKEGTKLIIVAPQGQVFLTANDQQTGLKIQTDSDSEDLWSTEINSGANTIRIVGQALESRHRMHDKMKIEISGKSVPVEIHVLDGSISIQKWTRDIFAHVQKGKIIAKNNSTTLVAHAQKGEITSVGHQGKMTADVVQASVMIKDFFGDLELHSFQGDITIDKAKGFLSLDTNQGMAKVLSGSGTFQFETVKGVIQAQSFEGRVEGHSQDGQINISMMQDQDVNVKAQAGKITIQTPPSSGALLSLYTADGDIYVPNYLKVSRSGSSKSLRGRLKGEGKQGSIVIRAVDGQIIIK